MWVAVIQGGMKQNNFGFFRFFWNGTTRAQAIAENQRK